MTTLLAIDGSIRCVGAALFRDGRLVWTGCAQWGKRSTKTNPGQRAQTIAEELAGSVPYDFEEGDLAYEWPQAYGDEKNPNDLFGILAVSGYFAGFCRAATSYLPREWCGSIPKAKTGCWRASPRAQKILTRLDDPDEQRVFIAATTHDAADAVGIGLHHLGRGILKRHRVLPGAT